MRRITALVAAAVLVVSACGAGDADPRIPVGQGWVVEYEQSSDLRHDWDDDRIVSGSVDVVLADGTSAVITTKTEVESTCTELLPPPASSGPCWLQVGPPAEDGHAEWAAALSLTGDSGRPRGAQDHFDYQAVRAGGGKVVDVTPEWIIFSSGRAVAQGAKAPTFEPLNLVHGAMADCPVDSIDELMMLGETSVRFSAVLDIDSGEVTSLHCWEDT